MPASDGKGLQFVWRTIHYGCVKEDASYTMSLNTKHNDNPDLNHNPHPNLNPNLILSTILICTLAR